jgi:hypothetical protein
MMSHTKTAMIKTALMIPPMMLPMAAGELDFFLKDQGNDACDDITTLIEVWGVGVGVEVEVEVVPEISGNAVSSAENT